VGNIIYYCYNYGDEALVVRRWRKALNGRNTPAIGSGKRDNADRSRSRITPRLHFVDGQICQTNDRRSVNRIRRRRGHEIFQQAGFSASTFLKT